MRILQSLFLLGCVLLFFGCSGSPQSAENTPAGSGVVGVALDSEAARQALADYLEKNPSVFESPGRTEAADEIRKVAIPKMTKGVLCIGLFQVDLDKKTYQLYHFYGEPGKGRVENWIWTGSFRPGDSGRWVVAAPEFLHESGERE
jgi:hypothetical protein